MLQPQNWSNIWADAILSAESNGSGFDNVRIVTTKSEFKQQLQEQSIDYLHRTNKPITIESIDSVCKQLINTTDITVSETVIFEKDIVFVSINQDKIDDDSLWLALDLIYEAILLGGDWQSPHKLKYNWDQL